MKQAALDGIPDRHESERGFVMILTLLVLLVLTVVCLAALDSSSVEIKIAANDRQSRVAFNLGDGTVYAAGAVISALLDSTPEEAIQTIGKTFTEMPDPTDPSYNPWATPENQDASITKISNVSGDFIDRCFGYVPPRTDGKYDYMLHIDGTGDAFVRMTYRNAESMAGGGSASHEGASGAGVSSGTSVVFDVIVDAYSTRNTTSKIEARYRKVLAAGGI